MKNKKNLLSVIDCEHYWYFDQIDLGIKKWIPLPVAKWIARMYIKRKGFE